MAKLDPPAANDRIDQLEYNLSRREDEIKSLKHTLTLTNNSIEALNAFIQEKFCDDLKDVFNVGYWYELKKEKLRKDLALRRATQELEQAGYTVTKTAEWTNKGFVGINKDRMDVDTSGNITIKGPVDNDNL